MKGRIYKIEGWDDGTDPAETIICVRIIGKEGFTLTCGDAEITPSKEGGTMLHPSEDPENQFRDVCKKCVTDVGKQEYCDPMECLADAISERLDTKVG